MLKIDWLMGIIWKGTSDCYLPRELYFLYWERWYLSAQERKDLVWNLWDYLPPKSLYGGEETQSRKISSDTWWIEICMLLWLASTMNLIFHLSLRMRGTNRAHDKWDLEKGCTSAVKMYWGMYQGDSNVDQELAMQKPWAVFIRKLTLETGRKSFERLGKLLGAVQRVSEDTWFMRFCLHHSWAFLSATLLEFTETPRDTDPAWWGHKHLSMLSN